MVSREWASLGRAHHVAGTGLHIIVVDLIDAENWSAMGADVKGDAYEGLLERNDAPQPEAT